MSRGRADDERSVVDLRSDAVTRPGIAMWNAMRGDPLAWSRGSDATVAELEARVADISGFPAAVFVPTGTMANTLALLVSTRPGDRFLVERHAHVVRAEGGAFRLLAGLQPQLVQSEDGHPRQSHLHDAGSGERRATLLWLENTHTYAGGTVAPPAETRAAIDLAHAAGMAVHVDGARLWNASVSTGTTVAALGSGADTVTLNLDKGLGCPGGALLCGSQAAVHAARERMIALGGLMAQQGLLAAAGLVALEGYVPAIERDHRLARQLAAGLRSAGVAVAEPASNIVLVSVPDAAATLGRLSRRGVLAFARDARTVRFVTHRDVGEPEIERVVAMSSLLCDG